MEVREVACRLRERQQDVLAAMTQAEVVISIAAWAHGWREHQFQYPVRSEAQEATDPFPFAHVARSLESLLDSLTPAALWRLIENEGVRDAQGVALTGHVIASNTPLLAWTSVLRALLMRSASLVKLPSGPAGQWGRWFHQSLADASHALASCVEMMHWVGGVDRENDAALCESVDALLAYGDDGTVVSLSILCPTSVKCIGYGHRVSFGVTTADQEADGFARDILTYDGGGCLTPQVIYVMGGTEEAQKFAGSLAHALRALVPPLPLPMRAAGAAARVREARALAQMEPDTQVRGDDALRWTVISRPHPEFTPSVGHGVVSVQPLPSWEALTDALWPVQERLQGCGVSENVWMPPALQEHLGISYACKAGRMQTPPFSWREDGRALLACLR